VPTSLERFKRALAGPAMGGGVVGCRLNHGRWAGPEGQSDHDSHSRTAIRHVAAPLRGNI
jgi:hypothetical protein